MFGRVPVRLLLGLATGNLLEKVRIRTEGNSELSSTSKVGFFAKTVND